MTPIEQLKKAAKERKVISSTYILEMVEKIEAEASTSPLRAKETKYSHLS